MQMTHGGSVTPLPTLTGQEGGAEGAGNPDASLSGAAGARDRPVWGALASVFTLITPSSVSVLWSPPQESLLPAGLEIFSGNTMDE